eukprot:TRINITY_DN17514_c0_g1_i1.p1 TRINITY_DN17514_c0_g1~~TRINITY_DN17514_c0_g1_i1.p1  ORF type:complete len:432 (+),score=34.91 TRINITY_DN17514_c0_g1_i1:47-1342(+)
MSNCKGSLNEGGEKTLASEVLWEDPPVNRLIVLAIGIVFAALALVLYVILISRHERRGKLLTEGTRHREHGAFFIPPKIIVQDRILYLGPVMTICFLVQMCVPELMTMVEVAATTYRAIAYYMMLQLIRLQFGFEWNIFREDGTGTLQQHKPAKIWAKPPCCCVWGCFYPFMKERIVTGPDLMRIVFLVKQFCVIGPVMAAVKMLVHYEGVHPDRAETTFLACNVVSMVSMLCAVYANGVAMKLVETCTPIEYQVRQRSWFTSTGTLAKEPSPLKNLSPKNFWIVIATVFPALATLIIAQVVTEDLCTDSGKVIDVQDLREYITGFVGILFNFLAAIFATTKAFPVLSMDQRPEMMEMVSANYLQMEIWPQYALERIPANIAGILAERAKQGKDPNLGFAPSAQWKEVFGEYISAKPDTNSEEENIKALSV